MSFRSTRPSIGPREPYFGEQLKGRGEDIAGSARHHQDIYGQDLASQAGWVLGDATMRYLYRVRIGRGSIRGGIECDACGGHVHLALNPIFLKPIDSDGPMIAGVL